MDDARAERGDSAEQTRSKRFLFPWPLPKVQARNPASDSANKSSLYELPPSAGLTGQQAFILHYPFGSSGATFVGSHLVTPVQVERSLLADGLSP